MLSFFSETIFLSIKKDDPALTDQPVSHTSDSLPEERFEKLYAAQQVPWDIGRPQRAFVEAAAALQGRILDSGCGTGELALWLDERGCTVTGVDFLAAPLEQARTKAQQRGLAVNFLQMDARTIGTLAERFDSVTDCGLFHVFDDKGRTAYVAALAKLLEPGARVCLLCFSDAEPGNHGPRRVSESEIRQAFATGWEVEKIEPVRFEVVPGIVDASFTAGGARAYFSILRRTDADRGCA